MKGGSGGRGRHGLPSRQPLGLTERRSRAQPQRFREGWQAACRPWKALAPGESAGWSFLRSPSGELGSLHESEHPWQVQVLLEHVGETVVFVQGLLGTRAFGRGG